MQLIALPGRPGNWNSLISPFETKTFFHESAWLDFVLDRDPRCRIDYYRIADGGKTVGYFCAVVNCRATFRLCESPDRGRGIHYPPIVNRDIDPARLVAAVVGMCRREGIASVDLNHATLSPALMTEFGFGWESNVAQICSLEGGSDAVWQRMDKTRRTSLRKAEREGLVAEATDDPALGDYFFRWYAEALSRKGIVPTCRENEVRSMLRHLLPADRLFAIWVKRFGRVIGAGLYLHDDHMMYYWDGASDPATLKYYPNDLLHWTAMQLAASRGIRAYQMACGPAPQPINRFALNFGCREASFATYRRSLIPLLKPLRNAHRWISQMPRPYVRRLGTMPVPVTVTAVFECL